MRRLIIIAVILFGMVCNNAYACFGTELIIGYQANDRESYYIAALLELYVKEKTGIEAKIMQLTDANLNLIDKEKVDLIVYPVKVKKGLSKIKLVSDADVVYYYRTKIKEDLRFSTLEEALVKLSSKLKNADLRELFLKLDKTGKVKRNIKEFLITKGVW